MPKDERPFIPVDSNEREFTPRAIILGVILSVIFGFANAWLGMKAGMTISAIYPAAVVAIAFFRIRKGGVLEQNIARTTATIGEAMAAAAIFTIPAFLIVELNGERLWTSFRYWDTVGIFLIGGILGILFIIFMRRALCVEADLPFPESYACAEIVKAGQKGASGFKYIFGAMSASVIIQILKDSKGLMIFKEYAEKFIAFPKSAIQYFAPQGTAVVSNHAGGVYLASPLASPALMGIGYIIGPKLSAINFSGGILAWLILIPFVLFIDPTLAERLVQNGEFVGWETASAQIWLKIVRPIAVGSMLMAGFYTLFKMRETIFKSMKGAFKKYSKAEETKKTRLDIDIPLKWVFWGIIVLLFPITWIFYYFSGSLTIALVAMIVMTATGFFLSAVSGYLVGLIGTSNQPVSGLTLIALLLTALFMVLFGMKGMAGIAAVLGVTAVVCTAVCTSGQLIQDVKAGQILGGTPWKMEIAQLISTFVVSFVIIYALIWLHQANIATGGIGGKELPAPQAGLMAQLATGIVSGQMAWGLVGIGVVFTIFLIMINAPSPMLIAIGMYLPFETTFAIFVGGMFKWVVESVLRKRNSPKEVLEKVENKGILLASGFVAGESITAIILALFVIITKNYEFSLTQLLTKKAELSFYASWGGWLSLIIFAVVAYALIRIPLKKEKLS